DQGIHPQLHVLNDILNSAGLPDHTLDVNVQMRALAEVKRRENVTAAWHTGISFLSGRSRALLIIAPASANASEICPQIPPGVTVIGITSPADESSAASSSSAASLILVGRQDELAEL